MSRREGAQIKSRTNSISASILCSKNENMFSSKFPTLKSKGRVLANAINKDLNRTSLSKGALERQRENASKLAAGRSVVDKANKENNVLRNKPTNKSQNHSQIAQKPQKVKGVLEERKSNLVKSQSLKSLPAIGEVKEIKKEKTTESVIVPKFEIVPEAQEPVEEIKPKVEEVENVIPPVVDVIDKEEERSNSEFLMDIYADDIYKFLKYLEKSQPIREDYLTSAHIMTPVMRSLLVDWLFEVQQLFKLLNETIHIAIALLDRFMQDHPSISKNELQLVGISCIFLASKYEEMYPPDLDDLVEISANAYTKMQIIKMEQLIFSSLDYRMGRPSPSQFLRRYGRIGKVEVITYFLAKYFVDLSLLSYCLCHVPPSLMAASALYLSLYLLSKDSESEVWTPKFAHCSEYTWDKLKPVVCKLASEVWEAPKTKYQGVRNKYLDSKKMHSVSALQELQSERLRKLALEV